MISSLPTSTISKLDVTCSIPAVILHLNPKRVFLMFLPQQPRVLTLARLFLFFCADYVCGETTPPSLTPRCMAGNAGVTDR